MRSLIRKIIVTGNQVGSLDQYVAGEQLAVGRGADQDIQLSEHAVALRHAVISLSGSPQIRALRKNAMLVNGNHCKLAELKVGDVIAIANYRLVVIEPPTAEVDFALTVEALATDEQRVLSEAQFRTRLAGIAWLRQRPAAWVAFFGVLLFALLLPLLSAWLPDVRKELGGMPVPNDSSWLAGPMHSAHAALGDDCQACHQQPFVRVEDSACIACHADTGQHVDPHRFDLPKLAARTCAGCHHEHNEAPSLVRDEQAFCVDCHADISVAAHGGSAVRLENVSDFGTAHPPFRLSMRVHNGEHWQQGARQAVTPTLREDSRLKFNHVEHLVSAGVKNETGVKEVLSCGSCHQRGADGASMQPLRMEDQCERCHSLTFDTSAPQRSVPHADSTQVLASLREFYSLRFIEKAQQGALARQPGVQASSRLQAAGVAWVEQEVARAGRDLFERRACAVCHEVKVTTDSKGRAAWQITPVSLNAHWFASAVFNHQKHESMDCTQCHQADKSKQAVDILLPDIASCQQCHVGKDAGGRGQVETGCVGCHRFHQQGKGIMGKAELSITRPAVALPVVVGSVVAGSTVAKPVVAGPVVAKPLVAKSVAAEPVAKRLAP